MDFSYDWLRQGLKDDLLQFRDETTRSPRELTGNVTMGRDLAHFAEGLSRVYRHYAAGLKEGAPFAFTYHHNELDAYAPLVVAVRDARLDCTAVLPAPAEMGASLHINGTASSTLDSVFVCRRTVELSVSEPSAKELQVLLVNDCRQMAAGGVRISSGDVRCLTNGHLTRLAINLLRGEWVEDRDIEARLAQAGETLRSLCDRLQDAAGAEAILAVLAAEAPDKPLALF
jgi:hypothetical protein